MNTTKFTQDELPVLCDWVPFTSEMCERPQRPLTYFPMVTTWTGMMIFDSPEGNLRRLLGAL